MKNTTSLLPFPPATSRVRSAQVITRWSGGCQIRIDDAIDTILPTDAVPGDWDEFQVLIDHESIVVLPNVSARPRIQTQL